MSAWATEADLDVERIVSNSFEIEWPPRSGKRATFPEVDRAGWFPLAGRAREAARRRQLPLLDRIAELTGADG